MTEIHELCASLRQESKQVTLMTARELMQTAATQLEKLEGEADNLAQEAARESARALAVEAKLVDPPVPDYLNVP